MEHSSTPAMAARAEPMAKVMEMVRSTSMPMSWAAALSSEQARMALPILVRPVNQVRASMMTTQASTVTMATWVTVSWPLKSFTEPVPTTEVNTLGSDFHSSRAEFWRK